VKRLTVRLSAEQELTSAAQWYESKQPGLGSEYLDAIDAAFQAVQEAPETFPTWEGTSYRKFVVQRFPYVVFYVVGDEEIEVVAVAHGRRRPGYWLNRDQ
jgi:toxin ParE1/3/4